MFKALGEGEESRLGEESLSIAVGGTGDASTAASVETRLVGVDGCGRVGHSLGELIV